MTRTLHDLTISHDADAGDPWRGFGGNGWRDAIDTRAFLQGNYTPYRGDAAFLAGATARTTALWAA